MVRGQAFFSCIPPSLHQSCGLCSFAFTPVRPPLPFRHGTTIRWEESPSTFCRTSSGDRLAAFCAAVFFSLFFTTLLFLSAVRADAGGLGTHSGRSGWLRRRSDVTGLAPACSGLRCYHLAVVRQTVSIRACGFGSVGCCPVSTSLAKYRSFSMAVFF